MATSVDSAPIMPLSGDRIASGVYIKTHGYAGHVLSAAIVVSFVLPASSQRLAA